MPEAQEEVYVDEGGITEYEDSDGVDPYVSAEGYGGYLLKLHQALGQSQGQAYADFIGTFDSIIADNDNFTMQDALDWYRRLGMIVPSSPIPLATMKAAINQKYRYPAGQRYRQDRAFIEAQLQAAGFNVFVYANNFGGVALSPADVLGIPVGLAVYGEINYGQANYGATYADDGVTLIANHIESALDADFSIPPTNYRSTFFIAGSTITTFADVPASRELEFRQLILQLKSAQTVGFLFVNYI